VEVFDQGYPGLALRISYGGGKSWVYFYRVGGKLRRMTLGTYPAMSLADAREAWRNARTEAQKGGDPATARKRAAPATSFTGVLEDWLKRDQAHNKTKDEVKRLIDKDATAVWQHRQFGDITRRDILDVIDSVADRGSGVTARRLHAHLHRLFKWAVLRGIIESNPAADLPKPGSETKRDRVLTDAELVSVWNAAAEELGWPFGPLIQLLILTGARRNEIGCLQWVELKPAEIELSGERTKNGEPHAIPLSKLAQKLVTGLPRIGKSDFVFTTNGTSPVSSWSKVKADLDKKVKIAPWRLHDLRRTVATGLQKLGVNLQVIEAVLGHVSGSRAGVVGVYQRHSFDAEKRVALEAWGAHVIGLVEGRKPAKVVPIREKA
jgi:integrase